MPTESVSVRPLSPYLKKATPFHYTTPPIGRSVRIMGLRSWISRRLGGPESKLQCDVLSAQLQLTRLARREGYAAVAVHATWTQSPILSRYVSLDQAPLARKLLCESVRLLRTNPCSEDYQTQLDAWLEIETSSSPISATERSLVRCVRDAAIAFHRGELPEQAMRVGRHRLPDASRIPTTDLTQVAKDLESVPPGTRDR